MQPDRATNNGGRTMELVAAAPRCQLLLIVLMSAMLLPGMKVSPLLIWRKIARTIELQENIGKGEIILHSVILRVTGCSWVLGSDWGSFFECDWLLLHLKK
ncbi:hypothetical protein STEG23_034757 [Scotinomys teguina]